jgi:antitoxin CptB
MDTQNHGGEDLLLRRKRLRYRAWHRGTREMDLVLGPYADRHLEGMDQAALDRFEQLMGHEDTELLKWVIGQQKPPLDVDTELLERLIAFRQGQAEHR